MLVLTDLDDNIIADENDRDVQDMITSAKVKGLDPSDWTNGYVKLQDTANLSKSAPVGHPFYGNQYKKIADLDADVGAAGHDVDVDANVSAIIHASNLGVGDAIKTAAGIETIKSIDDSKLGLQGVRKIETNSENTYYLKPNSPIIHYPSLFKSPIPGYTPPVQKSFSPIEAMSYMEKVHHLTNEHGQLAGSLKGQTMSGLTDYHAGLTLQGVSSNHTHAGAKVPETFVPFHDLSLGDKKQHLVQEHGQSLGSVAGQTQGGLEGIHQGLVASASHFHQPEKKSKVPVVPFYSQMDLPTKQKHMAYEHGNDLEWLKHQTEGAMNTMHAADHALGGASMLPHTHTSAPSSSYVKIEDLHPGDIAAIAGVGKVIKTIIGNGPDSMSVEFTDGTLLVENPMFQMHKLGSIAAQKTVKAMSLAPGDVVHFESGKDRVVEKVFSTAGTEREVTFTDGYWQYYQDDEMVHLTSEAGNSQPDTHMQAKDVKAGDVIQVGVGGQIRTVQKVERLGIDGLKITYTDGLVTYPGLTTIVRRISSDPEGAAQAEEAAKAEAAAKADMQAEEIAKNPPQWNQLSLSQKLTHLEAVEHASRSELPYPITDTDVDALHGSLYDPLTCTLSPEYMAPEERFNNEYALATTLEDKLRLIQQEFLAPWWGQKSTVVPALEDIKTIEQADKLRKFLVDYRSNFHNGAAKENPRGWAIPGPNPSDFGGSHMPSLLEEDSKDSLPELWDENWADWHSDYDDAVDNEENTSFKQLSAQRVAAEMVKLIPQSYIDKFLTGTSGANPVVSSSFVDAIQHPSEYWFTLQEGELRKWHKDTYSKEEIVNSADVVSQEDIIDGTDTVRLQKAKAEVVASQLIHNWAVSSNDADAISLAIQEAAAKEFGVEDITADTDDWRLFDARNRGWAALEKRTDLQTKVNGRLYRAFVRAQYNATQKWFKENNITKITLFRRQSLPFNLTVPADGEEATFPLRPLSSWSYDPAGAEKFSGRMMSITVPVSRVLSTTNSGNGCSSEHEIVVIGGTDTINILGENDY